MTRNEAKVIALALELLKAVVDEHGKRRADTVAVRLALRCLLPHCPENWPLTAFWSSAGQENDIGRSQGVNAAFNGIVLQLKKAGRYSG